MAPRALASVVGLAMVVMAALCSRASAQAGCTAMVVNMSPCLAYMTSNMSAPPATCCTQLDNIVQTQMACLCMFLSNASPFQIPVNRTQVLSLPGACNIKAGPLSQCNGLGMTPPAVSPPAPVAPGPASPVTPSSTPGIAPSPSVPVTPSTPSTPATPNAPSGSGSKVVPGGQVGGSSTTLRTHPMFFCFLVAVTSFVPSVIGF